MQYEFEVVDYGEPYWHESMISTLTGLPFEDAHKAVQSISKERWNGTDHIKALQSLGFSTNNRFVPFDKESPYPTILRCHNGQKGCWWLYYYCNGMVYDVYGDSFILDDRENCVTRKGKYYFYRHGMKVTSMLQVWI